MFNYVEQTQTEGHTIGIEIKQVGPDIAFGFRTEWLVKTMIQLM